MSQSGDFRLEGAAPELRYQGSFISVELVSYRGPDGEVHSREVVRHPGAVVVVPYLVSAGSVLCIEQFRVAANSRMLELPAGKRDVEGEDAFDCAARELEEELGIRARSWVHLATFFNSPGFTDELTYVFLARGLSMGRRDPQGAEEAAASLRSVRLMSLERLIAEGKLVDAKSIIGMYAARSFLEDMGIPESFDDDLDLDEFEVVELG
ncbi:MAG: NUDIX hydrolase [Actinomycetota bacterium]|nr:NUDIX hydrolase [Actinomycetota bacterium]